MAETIERLIQLVFDATDRTGPALKSLGSGVDDLSNRIESLTSPINSLTQSLLAIEGAAAAAGVAFISFAVKAAGEFDAGVREIVTLVNGGADEVARLKQEILNLAPSASSFETVTKAVYSAVSATGDLDGSLKAMHTAEQLALAGRAELSDSTLLLVSSINAFGASMEDAQHFADVFFTAVQQGQTTLPEFAASFGSLAPVAKAAGLSLEETVAAVTTLTKSGVGTSEAMTGIKAALTSIIKPTGDAGKVAKELGIQFDQSALAGKGLQGFLDAVGQATGGNVTKMGQLVGSVEGLNAMLLLTGNQGETFNSVLAAMEQSTGNVAKAAELMGQSVAIHTQAMVNAMYAALQAIGDPLLTPFTEVEDAIGQVFTAIRQAAQSGAFDPLIQYVETNLTELRDAFTQVAKELPEALRGLDWSGFVGELQSLREAVISVFPRDLDLSSAQGLQEVLQRIINLGERLIAWTRAQVEFFAPVIRGFLELASSASEADKSLFELAGKMSALSQALDVAVPALNLASGGLNLLGGAMTYAAAQGTTLTAVLAGVATGPAGMIALGAAAAVAAGQFEQVRTPINSLIDDFKLWFPGLGRGSELLDAMSDASRGLTDSLGRLVGGFSAASESERLAQEQAAANRQEFADWATAADELGGRLQFMSEGLIEVTDILPRLTEELDPLNIQWQSLSANTLAMAESLKDPLLKNLLDTKDSLISLNDDLELVNDTLTTTPDAFQRLSNAASDTRDSLTELSERTDLTIDQQAELARQLEDVNLKWGELESQERQLVFELQADIAIAQIEAGAQVLQSAFESITASIESTGESFNTLIGAFVELQGTVAQGTIKDLMEEELKLRKDSLAQQKDLIKAQVDYLNAINERLGSGEAMINISTDGLEPALTNLMWEVLRKIQIEASAQGQQFLLGLPAAA
jgi:TP901 family phage tail tape measure protein